MGVLGLASYEKKGQPCHMDFLIFALLFISVVALSMGGFSRETKDKKEIWIGAAFVFIVSLIVMTALSIGD